MIWTIVKDEGIRNKLESEPASSHIISGRIMWKIVADISRQKRTRRFVIVERKEK